MTKSKTRVADLELRVNCLELTLRAVVGLLGDGGGDHVGELKRQLERLNLSLDNGK